VSQAFGPPLLRAAMRTQPEDFVVDEDLGFEPSGEGEHLLLRIEKRGANTSWVAEQLARWAGVASYAVGYAGLKDRHAVARQSFSVHLPTRRAPALDSLEAEGVRVLSAAWHRRKLPRGALRGNRFRLLLRGLEGDRAAIGERLQAIAGRGFPNAFGAQRFGHGGGNLERARALFAGARVGRAERGMLLSAARSALFNAVLQRRVGDGSWQRGLEGEVWMLDGRSSIFGPEPLSDELAARAAALQIHPTGPLWGRGESAAKGAVLALEQAVVAGFAEFADGLERAGLSQERRALRARAGELAWDFPADGVLELSFFLPRGSFATALLAVLGEVTDASGRPVAED
jgi:tRNA pseudouridine13 synthase